MDVKEAVQVEKNYVIELFAEEGIVDVGLEEAFDLHTSQWGA